MNAKSRNTVCNLGILANAFEMTASGTTNAFLFVDQAQRLDTGFAENLVEDHFGYFKEDTFQRDIEIKKKKKMTVITTVRIIMVKRNRKVPFISSKKFLWCLTLRKL